ncbi:MAG: hypothetical protein H6732_01315 [Alphaproteobacteria bacterium]|nr:hypothetical protein [Alphaproteobacteria bacterium]
MRWCVVLGVLGACSGVEAELPSEAGLMKLCMTTDQAEPPAPSTTVEGAEIFRVSGTVTEVGAHPGPLASSVQPCWGASGGGQALTLLDADEVPWRLSWLATEGVVDRTPDLAVLVGEAVSLTMIRDTGAAGDAAVVLRDADGGLLLASEEGFGASLDRVDATLLPEFAVERGGSTGRFFRTKCGQVITTEVTFTAGKQALDLDVWVQGTLTLPQGKVQARNPGAYDFIGEVTCAGVTGPTPWIVYVPGTESGF